MKKMLDSKFLFILGLSILVLIGLGTGAYYLFDNSDNYFIKSGYVINPLSSKVEKYFFEEETSYHENLSSMIEFKDADNNNVTILKDSFLHYNDGSMSLLKNGAILDLNSINGKDAVAFYNITNESIIEKTNNNYIIKTSTNDIKFKNFIGRISDDKYIIVGNLELKIPGNNTAIKGDYFEIVYSENGVVDIENRETKYQVTAEGTYIYTGEILIDLGNKKITKRNEDIMSITAITIDGDENIEIIPKAKEEPTTKTNNNAKGNDNEPGNGNDNNINENNNAPNNGTSSTVEKENTLTVNISEAKVTSTDITLRFDIENSAVTDDFSLRVTNLENGTMVKKITGVEPNRPYTIPFLNPSTKYLFTIVNESDNSKYVQKMYETNPLGISIEKDYATENKLGYIITVDENSEVTYAKIILKKFDEETGKTETVKNSEGNDKIIELKNIENGKSYERFFSELDSDSIYTAVLTDFKVPPYNIGSDDEDNNYKLAVTAMTLKKIPDFGNVNITKDKTESKFKFAINDIIDEDNAIVSYTYLIYHYEEEQNEDTESEANNTSPARKLVQSWPAIVKNNASPIEIPVGEGTDKLSAEPKYYYKVVIEYFDNEKILEHIITDKDGFEMEKEPLVKIEPNKKDTSYNRIVGTIYLTDNSCLLSNSDEECTATRNATVQIIDDPTGASDDITNDNDSNAIIVATRNVVFTPVNGKLQASIDVGNLEENKFYTIRVKANRTDMPNSGLVKIEYADAVKGIKTKSLSAFYIDWHDEVGNRQDVVNVTSRFIADATGELGKEESALAIKRVEISLYEGELSTEVIENGGVSPIANPKVELYINDFDIKNAFCDNSYQIGSEKTFNMDFETLASSSSNGKVQKNYTIYIKAYYDEGGTKPINLSERSYSYRVDDALLREDIGEMDIKAIPIIQGKNGPYTNLNIEETVIGYEVRTSWEINKLLAAHFEPKKIRIYVIDKNNPDEPIYFYVEGEENPRKEIYEDIGISTTASVKIFMNYGSETQDNIMRRGNDYYIGFEIDAMSTSGDNEGKISHLPINDDGIPRSRGKFTLIGESKEIPTLTMHPWKTTENSVTFAYEIDDPDNGLHRENNESDYELFYDIDGIENSLSITDDKQDSVNYNKFEGKITISNLNKGDYFAIYLKTKDKENNILKYPNVTEFSQRLFEGEYNAVDYNFNFDIINNELTDNRVKVKILADDELLERVVNYKLTFTTKNDNNEIDKTKELSFGMLSSCGGIDAEKRCLIVDYNDLKSAGMKSTTTKKEITVQVEIMYDNGLTGYGYKVGNSEDDDYKYMIMQDNNTKLSPGKFIILNNSFNPVFWNESQYNHKGYYRYSIITDKQIKYTSIYAKNISASSVNSSKTFPEITPSAVGKLTTIQNNSNVALNPKMLTFAVTNYDDDDPRNKFSFSSYTPTIDITNEATMINGEEFTIELYGADLSEFCEESNGTNCVNHGNSGTYNLYIDVWDNLDDIGNKDKIVMPTTTIQILPGVNRYTKQIIEGLDYNKQYYFRVYAWLKKNNVKNYTQLFDETETNNNNEFTTKNYPLKTKGSELLQGIAISSVLSTASSSQYGDRLLNTELKLQNVKFNYDITYVVCKDTATEETCIPYNDSNSNMENDPRLLTNTIKGNKLTSIYNDKLAIDRDFEHNKDYKIYVYAAFEYYENYAENKSASTVPKQVFLGAKKVNLLGLTAPSFQDITRKAIIDENGEYAIEITPHIKDDSKVLVNGNYYIKLLSGSSVVGTMQVMEGNSYVTVGEGEEYISHSFSIDDINNQTNPVRITGLTEDTPYSIVVFGMVNLNNYDANIPIAERTKEYKTDPPISVYTTNESGVAFGNIEFTSTQNSIVLTFLGGSNISNIDRIEYTIGNWSNYNPKTQKFYDETITFHDEYLTSEHGFRPNGNGDPQYTISPPGFTPAANGQGNPSIIKFYLNDGQEITRFGAPVYEP